MPSGDYGYTDHVINAVFYKVYNGRETVFFFTFIYLGLKFSKSYNNFFSVMINNNALKMNINSRLLMNNKQNNKKKKTK